MRPTIEVDDGAGELIRTDKRGRMRYSAEQRELLLDSFDRSGQTAMAFASQHGVKYPTLMSWLGKRRREGGGNEPAPSFAELVVDEPGVERMSSTGLVVRLGGGMIVEIGSRTSIPLAVELIEALGSRR